MRTWIPGFIANILFKGYLRTPLNERLQFLSRFIAVEICKQHEKPKSITPEIIKSCPIWATLQGLVESEILNVGEE